MAASIHRSSPMFRSLIRKIRGLSSVLKDSFTFRMGSETKLIVKRVPSEKNMNLSFKYSSAYVKERWFHLQRDQTEHVKTALARIAQNVHKETLRTCMKRKHDGNEPVVELDSIAKDEVKLYFDGREVDGETTNAEAFQEGAVLKVGQFEFPVDLNPPRITKLRLPKTIMAGYCVFPNVAVQFAEVDDCSYEWFRSKTGEASDWEKVGDGFAYTTADADVGRYLKIRCTPSTSDRSGIPNETVSTAPVGEGPGECPFHRRHAFTKDATVPGRFRIMSYNILADLYADSDTARKDLFPTCPAYALDVDYRRQLLLKEIEGYNCDVFCLQEVDSKMFDRALLPMFSKSVYDGVFTSKSGKVAEGLACFYNKNKFSFISQHDVVLSDALRSEPGFADYFEAISKNELLLNKFLNRTTVLQVVLLKSLDVPERKLCVANTHLYFKPTADNIRLLQSGMSLRHIEQVVALESAKDPNSKVAVVFCGDFNSTPPFGVYQLMTTQFIPDDHSDWKSEQDEAITFSVHHPFALISACGTPDYTNYTVGFNGCLDYIFSESTFLRVEESVPLPTHEEVTEFDALPSIKIPSDHLPLICTLKWK